MEETVKGVDDEIYKTDGKVIPNVASYPRVFSLCQICKNCKDIPLVKKNVVSSSAINYIGITGKSCKNGTYENKESVPYRATCPRFIEDKVKLRKY